MILDPFPLTLDDGAAVARLNEVEGAVICTMPEPWALVAVDVRAPLRLIGSGSVELDDLRELSEKMPEGAEVVIGLGGGSSMDTAKFVAEVTGLPLIQIPTIVSVDAAFTPAYAYRDGSRVRYAGDLRPTEVIADPSLIRKAPRGLNRAGVGDLLSCHTAIFDWKLATDSGRGDVPWNEEAAALGRRVLDDLESASGDIAAVSDEAVRFLARSHQMVGAACAIYGARFEEGSEHFLAYCHEWLTGEHRVHGELISFGVVAMSLVQGNDPERAMRVLRATGVDARPSHLGIDGSALARMFAALAGYCAREELWPSVVETVELTPELAREVFEQVCSALEDDPGSAR